MYARGPRNGPKVVWFRERGGQEYGLLRGDPPNASGKGGSYGRKRPGGARVLGRLPGGFLGAAGRGPAGSRPGRGAFQLRGRGAALPGPGRLERGRRPAGAARLGRRAA